MLGRGFVSMLGEEGLEAGAGERARNLCVGISEMRRLRPPLAPPDAAAPPRSVECCELLPPMLPLAVSAADTAVVFALSELSALLSAVLKE